SAPVRSCGSSPERSGPYISGPIAKAQARFKVTVHPPFLPEQTGDTEDDVRKCVERITKIIEAEVRENPSQWFWQHRRWPKEAWRDAGVM
ncbi:MAG: hypothetical protein AAGK93_12510, partial [Pseudomonadota bacterium]